LKNRKIRIVGLFLLVLIVSGASLLWFASRTPSFQLADGRSILVTRAKVGLTNEFKHGTDVEKVLGNAISSNGWKLGKWTLQRPEVESFGWSTNAELLTVEFEITPPRNGATTNTSFPFYFTTFDRNYRILHWGEDGFRYTEELSQGFFKQRRDGYFGYLGTMTYARTSPQLHVEFQSRESTDAEWLSVATLSFPNPKQSEAQAWQVQKFPITNSFGDFTAVLGAIQVQQPRDNVTPYRDIWQHAVDIPFKFFIQGQAVTNWSAQQMAVRDASGNYHNFGAFKSYTNGWTLYRAWRSADPGVPWRFTGHFTEESEFTPSDLFTIRIPIPYAGSLVTNFAGLKTTADFVNGNMLNMRIPENTKGRRLVLVDAFNETGESVKEWTGSWGQNGFMKAIDTSKVKSNLTVTVAIVRDIEFEFIVQPVLVQELTPPSQGHD
jgi:hypothetical protein